MMINRATKEMTIKIVYYGPGLCGKTTNLEQIYEKAVPEKKGKLLTVATESDRTLFFDFLPMELGQIRGMKLRVQLYTVPGQVFYDATRRIVLRGSDGVVFVADSQAAMLEANVESLNNLKKNLQLNNLDPETIPLVFQYNKQDLADLASPEEMNAALNWRNLPAFPGVAAVGKGVNETLKKIIELVVRRVHEQEDALKQSQAAAVSLPAQPPQAAEAVAPAQPEPPPAPHPPQPPSLAPPPPAPHVAAPVRSEERPAPVQPLEELPSKPALEAVEPPAPPAELEVLPVEVVPEEETPKPIPVEAPRPFATDLAILDESLEELEKRAAAMARDLAELRSTVLAMKDRLGV